MNNILDILKTKKLLIGMITKNVSKHLPKVLKNAMQYSSYFNSYKAIIIDGYSTDTTYDIGKFWCKADPQNRFIYKQPSSFLPRPLALSEARNMYISLFENDFGKDTYMLLMDCDEVNTSPIDEEGFLSNFKYPLDSWDMMSANQRNSYYDIYALRNDECPWNYQDKLRETGDTYTYLTKLQQPKPRDHPLIKCKSAFGGLAIYHTEKLKGCRYTSFIGNPFNGQGCKEVCEHVPFHQELINNGGKLFINPNFINM